MARQLAPLDDLDYDILRLLQADGRQSLRALAQKIDLSPAATTARVNALEDRGVITGYQAVVDPTQVGRAMRALIRVTAGTNTTKAVELTQRIADHHPAVRSVYRTLGDSDQVFYVEATDLEELDALVDDLGRYYATNTAMVVEHRQQSVRP